MTDYTVEVSDDGIWIRCDEHAEESGYPRDADVCHFICSECEQELALQVGTPEIA